jgi:D-amino-acid dehydrogenase
MEIQNAWSPTPQPIPGSARDSDVIVVGGGVVGVSTALFLRERGASVTLLERGGLAAGASYGNAGWIFPSHSIPLPGPGVAAKALGWLLDPESPLYIRPTLRPAMLRWLWRFWRACDLASAKRSFALNRELSLASRACYESRAARPGFDFGYARSGLVLVFESREGLREVEQEIQWLEELGGEAKRLDAGALRDLEPSLAPDSAGGVLFSSDGFVEPAPFVHQAGQAASTQGAAICCGTEVLALHTSSSGVEVETTRGVFRARQAVLAAGAWNTPLARLLGCRIPIEAAKGYSISVEKTEGFGARPLMLAEAKVGVSPMGQMLRFAGTLELAGLDLRVNSRRVGAIRRAVERFLPGASEAPHLETWRGLRPLTPDDLPILGRLARHPAVIVAGGHGMSGMSQGPITGQLIAALACGDQPALDLAPFAASRFGV